MHALLIATSCLSLSLLGNLCYLKQSIKIMWCLFPPFGIRIQLQVLIAHQFRWNLEIAIQAEFKIDYVRRKTSIGCIYDNQTDVLCTFFDLNRYFATSLRDGSQESIHISLHLSPVDYHVVEGPTDIFFEPIFFYYNMPLMSHFHGSSNKVTKIDANRVDLSVSTINESNYCGLFWLTLQDILTSDIELHIHFQQHRLPAAITIGQQ